MRSARAAIYDRLIVPLTAGWYRAVLTRLPRGSRLLDVGIGTGSALLANIELARERAVRVTGIDIDSDYVARCQRSIAQAGGSDVAEVKRESVYDHRGGPYDAAYFSASFMLLPDPPAALRHVATLLTGDARIYFTQTFEHRRSRIVEIVKPLLRLATTIDFGRVTYEAEFRAALAAGGVEIDEWCVLNAGARRSSILVSAQSR